MGLHLSERDGANIQIGETSRQGNLLGRQTAFPAAPNGLDIAIDVAHDEIVEVDPEGLSKE
jgi:hypothetical protein